jgi:hypothetical protein
MITAEEFDRLADLPVDDPAGDLTPYLDLSKARPLTDGLPPSSSALPVARLASDVIPTAAVTTRMTLRLLRLSR